MAIVRWQPFAEMETLRRQMDRVFDELSQGTISDSPLWKPVVELKDEGDAFTLRAQVPGIEGKDLDIQATRESVTLSGESRYEKTSDEKGVYHSEFHYGQFKRVINLPVAIQNDKVEADLTNGVLTLKLPKVEEAVNRVVKVDLK
ncbi:Hsp20/alpha crystallin family protein [Spirulina sp. CS-785/01]|uniref:Hsp20/alpha crystallin family protein n=1 Tax=Spirulina sp. CS-785/01 TaxID=3021716 RepID=UPI00232BA994|nr:Hsp20/alpha crystallin family protein [Spirulina sp. CS-785/01]MDB9314222.1 Hsp20/alpha crystallin family protein [Spirulina sp. CS-785/01]